MEVTGMEVITTAITNVATVIGSGLDFLTAEPLFMIPIGMSLISAAVYFVKGLI